MQTSLFRVRQRWPCLAHLLQLALKTSTWSVVALAALLSSVQLIQSAALISANQHTWRRNASSSPVTLGSVIFVRPTPMSASSRCPVLYWATEVSVLQDHHESGTVCPVLCDSLSWTLTVSATIEDIFVCLRPRRTSDFLFFDAPCINSFTYLLTWVTENLLSDCKNIVNFLLVLFFAARVCHRHCWLLYRH